ncbi:hypothetical protein FOA52_005497 [Chlamydomonas sp. UWO 241]|nr:hypothetical protein FOA52_005497 [Chlamydomonas sp. UWO 241]
MAVAAAGLPFTASRSRGHDQVKMTAPFAWSITQDGAVALIADTKDAYAGMEEHFPAWHCTINRHMVMHVAESIVECGPALVTSVLPFERLWKMLVDWMSQCTHPEANMMRSYRAYKVAAAALAEVAAHSTDHLLAEDEDDDDSYTMGVSNHVRLTIDRGPDRSGDAVLMPGAALSAEVNVYDGRLRTLNWLRKQHKAARRNASDLWLDVEMHKLFLRNQSPENSPAGLWLSRYLLVWRMFMVSESSSRRMSPLTGAPPRPDREALTPAVWLEKLNAWRKSLSNTAIAKLIGKWGRGRPGTQGVQIHYDKPTREAGATGTQLRWYNTRVIGGG